MTYYEYINSKVTNLPSPAFIKCNTKEILRHVREVSREHIIWNIVLENIEAECDIPYLRNYIDSKESIIENYLMDLGVLIKKCTTEIVDDDESIIVLPFDAYTVERLQRNDVTTIGSLKYMISSGLIREVFDYCLEDVLDCVKVTLDVIDTLDINDALLRDLKERFALYNINNLLTVFVKLNDTDAILKCIKIRIDESSVTFHDAHISLITDYLNIVLKHNQKPLIRKQDLIIEVNGKHRNISKRVFTEEVCEGLG